MPKQTKKSRSKKQASQSSAGMTKSATSSYKAMTYMIKQGYMAKLDDSNLSDMKSYSSKNKSPAVKEMEELYSQFYPDLFGHGSAHSSLAKHYSEGGSAGQLRSLINRLIDADKLSESIDSFTGQNNPLLKSISELKDQKDNRMMQNMTNTPVGGTLTYSRQMFDKFGKPFEKYNESIKTMLDSNLFGPARIILRNLFDQITRESQGLKASVQFVATGSALSSAMNTRVTNLKTNTDNFINGFVAASASVSQNIGLDTTIEVATGDTFTFQQILSQSADTVENLKTYLDLVSKMTDLQGNFASPYGGNFSKLRFDMAGRQNQWGQRELGNAITGGQSAISREALHSQLYSIAQTIGTYKGDGTISTAEYNKLKAKFEKYARDSRQIPSPGEFAKQNADNPQKFANMIYTYRILVLAIAAFGDEVSNLTVVKAKVDELQANNRTKKFCLELATHRLGEVSSMSKATQEQRTAAGVDQDALQKAIKAVQALRQTVNKIRHSRNDKEARSVWATYIANADYIAGWITAKTLADAADFVSMKDVVKSQTDMLKKLNTGSDQQTMLMQTFMCSPEKMFVREPFASLATATKNKAEASGKRYEQVIKDVGGGRAISAGIIPSPEIKNPVDLLASLPSSVRALSKQHAQARAQAIPKFLTLLMGGLKSAAQYAPQGGWSGGQAQSQQDKNIYGARIKALKDLLNAATYDSSYRNANITFAKGLHICGFGKDTASWGSSAALQAPMGITYAWNLLWEPVFRGDSLYNDLTNKQAKRTATWKINDKTIGLTQTEDGVDYLARRHALNSLGQNEVYDWNPLQAQDLRFRYLVSLYPFSLKGKFKELYDAELAAIKTRSAVSSVEVKDLSGWV